METTISQITRKINDIVKIFDPQNVSKDLDPIEKVNEINADLDTLQSMLGKTDENSESLNAINLIREKIKDKGRDWIYRDGLENELLGKGFEEMQQLEMSVSEITSEMLRINQEGAEEVSQTVIRIQNLVNGRSGIGLSKAQTQEILENLTRR